MFFLLLSTFIIFKPNPLPLILPSFQSSDSITEVSYGYEPTDNLIADLRKGGYVIFFRHTATDRKQKDLDLDFKNCDTQRNLNQKGREQAQAIAVSFKRLNIPVGTVLASPFCRTLETAQIAFGKSTQSEGLVSIHYARNKTPELVQSLVQMLRTVPSEATNTILVGHGVNLDTALELNLEEGGAAIFKPKSNLSFVLVAQIQEVEAWEAEILKQLK